jgi:hypothetical protein
VQPVGSLHCMRSAACPVTPTSQVRTNWPVLPHNMEADERTALLGNGEAANSTRLTVDYPPLRVAVDELLRSGSLPDDVPDLPASFSLGAYHVMALLSAVQELSKAADSPVDLEEMYVAQDQERKGGELAEKAQWQCKQVLANVTSNNDLEVLMWTPILEQESSSRYVRCLWFNRARSLQTLTEMVPSYGLSSEPSNGSLAFGKQGM